VYRGINDFKKGYQPRIQYGMRRAIWLQTATVFWPVEGTISLSCSMYVGVSDVRQKEIHTAEPSAFGVEMSIEKLKRHKSPGTDKTPAEMIQVGGRTIRSEIHNLLTVFGIRRKCLRSGRNRPLYLFIRKVIKLIVVIIYIYTYRYIFHFC